MALLNIKKLISRLCAGFAAKDMVDLIRKLELNLFALN